MVGKQITLAVTAIHRMHNTDKQAGGFIYREEVG